MRGKPWSVDEERQLRRLLEEGKSLDEISRIMGKTRIAVKGKFFNLGLNSLIVATEPCTPVATTTATTTSPAAPVPAPMSVPASASTPASVTAPVSGRDCVKNNFNFRRLLFMPNAVSLLDVFSYIRCNF